MTKQNKITAMALEAMDLTSMAIDNTKEMLKGQKHKLNADADNLDMLNRSMELLDLIIAENKTI